MVDFLIVSKLQAMLSILSVIVDSIALLVAVIGNASLPIYIFILSTLPFCFFALYIAFDGFTDYEKLRRKLWSCSGKCNVCQVQKRRVI